MTCHRVLLSRRLLVMAMVAFAGIGPVARAQDDDDAPPQPMAAVVIQQPANFDQLDQWVFGRLGGSVGARNKLDSSLSLRIEEIGRVCGLTEDQKKKLRLAGRGDIKRFYDKVEELKRRFQQGQNDPNMNIWQAIQPLQVEINTGLFGDESLYAKTIRRTLTADQSARFDGLARSRRSLLYRSTVEWFVVHLDKGLGMTDDQRHRFAELLLADVRPPTRFGQGDYWYLMSRTSRLPESQVKPIFDAPQWRLLSRQFEQARGMEGWLKLNGIEPDEENAGETPGTAGPSVSRARDADRAVKAVKPSGAIGRTTSKD